MRNFAGENMSKFSLLFMHGRVTLAFKLVRFFLANRVPGDCPHFGANCQLSHIVTRVEY